MSMENPCVNSIPTHFNLQKMAHSTFPPRFKQTFAFQPFRLFRYSFQDISNLVSLHLGYLVYKLSPVYSALAWRKMILHWQTAWSKHLNKGMPILSDLELLALPYVAPITAISWFPEYRLYYVHKLSSGLVGR